ncbi:Uncharacterized protein DAT39_008126 [Clarias magur]|uniref:Uncharacterized protein n=1 Tax=Clarias magur TaxID=1594786 RepID=A0A8J4U1R3_CLAMG|nr:Uncharacterized protein DAT39_008126 [Clarias magur]
MADAAAYCCRASGSLPAPDIWLLCYHWLIGSREATLMTLGEEGEWPGEGELSAHLEWIRALKSFSKHDGGLRSWPLLGV